MNWQDWTPVLSVIIAAAALYFSRKKDTQSDTATITTAIVKIDEVGRDVSDVKADVKALRDETRADHDEIVIMRGKVNALGERVDELKTLVKP